MTKKNTKDGFARGAQNIDLNVGNLIGTLGEALNEIINRLDDGHTGEVTREHTFETEKGPVRAQAGIRVRMGGPARTGDAMTPPRPVNAKRKEATQAAPETNAPRTLSYDLIEDDDQWILTAEMPGVSTSELQLKKNGMTLEIETTGIRKYATSVVIDGPFDLNGASTSLHNGILNLGLPKGSGA